MDEEKTIDEAVEEQADEMKEFEPVAFDEVIKEEPTKETAPVLRAVGDPDPADMSMIHKHLDNFLAKIAGETPIDENVRDSTEYWLNRIAEAGGGGTTVIANPTLAGTEDALTGLQVGETKYKIGVPSLYRHTIDVGSGSGMAWFTTVVYTTDSEPFTAGTFKAYLQTNFPTIHKGLPVSGGYPDYGILTSIYYNANNGKLGAEYSNGTGGNNNGSINFNTTNFSDTVHQIM